MDAPSLRETHCFDESGADGAVRCPRWDRSLLEDCGQGKKMSEVNAKCSHQGMLVPRCVLVFGVESQLINRLYSLSLLGLHELGHVLLLRDADEDPGGRKQHPTGHGRFPRVSGA